MRERCIMTAMKGLEGIVAATSSISSIHAGILTYRGINIDELAEHASYEETAYLLWYGHLPNEEELTELRARLSHHSALPEQIIQLLKTVPKDANPMAVLRTAVSALAFYDEDADHTSKESNQAKAIKLQAQIPTIVAAYARIREGKEPVAPLPNVSIAHNFLYMLSGVQPSEIAISALDKAFVLHADHEFNASTFSARVTVATLTDIYSAVTSAIGTLKGPLHGGANEAVMKMLDEIGVIDHVDSYIEQKLRNRQKIMGFGHRVYKNGDPRAKHLQKMSYQLGMLQGDTTLYDISVRVEELVTKHKGLKPNVDFYSASVYSMLGIPRDLFTPIFVISRLSGWTAHIIEQLDDNRIIRPRAEYIGVDGQKYVPLELR